MLSVCRVTDTRGCGRSREGLYTHDGLAYSPRNVFDVLVYLYENYGALHACPDADSLTKRLTAAGFDDEEITEALAWLSGLEQVTQESIAVGPESDRAFRVYAKIEVDRLGTEGDRLPQLPRARRPADADAARDRDRARARHRRSADRPRNAQGDRADGAVEPAGRHRRPPPRGTPRRRGGAPDPLAPRCARSAAPSHVRIPSPSGFHARTMLYSEKETNEKPP